LSAGDASGDVHAAALVSTLRDRHDNLRFIGLGGPRMRAAGVELVADQRDLAIGGLLELVGGAAGIRRAWRSLGACLDRQPPDLCVLVDSGGFNLPFARRVRRRGGVPILYYIAPQVWAWRTGRIRKLVRRVDRLAVIFPFERQVYEGKGLKVDFVGHPLVDELGSLAAKLDPPSARAALGLSSDRPWIALLPGSRSNEIDHHLPIQLATAKHLHAVDPDIGFVLAPADSIERRQVDRLVANAALPADLALEVVAGRTHEAIRASTVALVKPGTVTVEAMLLATPMVVMGHANALTAAILRRSARISYMGMPNLIAGREIVPEFLQQEARPGSIAAALLELTEGPARQAQLARLAEARASLGAGGAACAASRIVEEMLDDAAA
jgi:lipid-A-disaccharide synthase